MMRSLVICLVLILLPQRASAFSYAEHGIGLAVGEPGGITGFYRIDDKAFVQAFIGRSLLFGVDYNFAFPGAVKSASNVTPYLGFGGFLFSSAYWSYSRDVSGFGIRMPVGILVQVPEAPFHFHLEIAPATTVSPFMFSFAEVMGGVRFLF